MGELKSLSDSIFEAANPDEKKAFISVTKNILDSQARTALAKAVQAELEAEEAQVHAKFQSNANMRKRVLPYVGEIEPEGVEQAVDILTRWARESDDPITVRFTSPGGDAYAGLVLYDALRGISADGTPIKTIVLGNAFSMAAVLLQAGDERVIAPHSFILVHKGKITLKRGASMDEADQSIMAKQTGEIDKMMAGVLAERSNLTQREILTKITKGDWYLKAEDCKKYGFADRIGYK